MRFKRTGLVVYEYFFETGRMFLRLVFEVVHYRVVATSFGTGAWDFQFIHPSPVKNVNIISSSR